MLYRPPSQSEFVLFIMLTLINNEWLSLTPSTLEVPAHGPYSISSKPALSIIFFKRGALN